MVHTTHQAIKKSAIPNVMLRSALAGRSSGALTSFNDNGRVPGLPNPIVPTPGINPNQFAARMKINRVARRGNTLGIMCRPTIPENVLYSVSTTPSKRFCGPDGTSCISRVAQRATQTISAVTITVNKKEFVNQLANGETGVAFTEICSAAIK